MTDSQLLRYNKAYFTMVPTFKYQLNKWDYDKMVPDLLKYMESFNMAGGSWEQLKKQTAGLGTPYQNIKIQRIMELDYIKISTEIVTKEVQKVTNWTLNDFLEFSDEWAEDLDNVSYSMLSDDMEEKLIEYFEQGGDYVQFLRAFAFGDEEEQEYIYELIFDLYKVHVQHKERISLILFEDL